ncbi:MAG: hypothetical protein F6K30_03020 [Cyanothece sp. SIO2G6]|nr:hypothetical protein [Cyanothece sp. SIO2G6]
MLFDPEKKTRIDMDTRVPTGDTGKAHKICREIAEQLRRKGNVMRHLGVKKNKSGKSHQCIQAFEVDDEEQYN